jgi:hypothetical protein
MTNKSKRPSLRDGNKYHKLIVSYYRDQALPAAWTLAMAKELSRISAAGAIA